MVVLGINLDLDMALDNKKYKLGSITSRKVRCLCVGYLNGRDAFVAKLPFGVASCHTSFKYFGVDYLRTSTCCLNYGVSGKRSNFGLHLAKIPFL